MALELHQLRQAIALAEHGSFVRAAAALHISQPALSRSIQNLEAKFGSELFVRSSSGVVPTDLGRLYLERARDLLRMADELDREAVTHGSLGASRLSVGGGPFPLEAILAPAAVRFVEQYPKVSILLQGRDWDEMLRQLRSRELDFFVGETSTLHRDPDLEVVPMQVPHPVYLFARASHPLASRKEVDVVDVFPWPFVAPGRIPPRLLDPLLTAHRSAARHGVVRPFPNVQCTGLATVRRIVKTCDAVGGSILPCIADELESGEFVLLSTAPWLHVHYGIVSLKGRPWTQAAERFRDAVLDAEQECLHQEEQLARRFRSGGARKPPRRAPRRA